MDYKVVVPPLGESVVEGTIVKWLKNEGDQVKADDPLVEIMTDKINVEIPAAHDGVMKKHLVKVDTVVEIGDEIAIMEVEGEVSEAKTFDKGEKKAEPKPAEGEEKKESRAEPSKAEAEPEPEKDKEKEKLKDQPTPREQKTAEAPREFVGTQEHHEKMGIHADEEAIGAGIEAVKSSPVVRRLAREHFIDLRKVKGTGKDGRVSKKDVLDYIEMRHTVDVQDGFQFPGEEREEVIPVTGVRKVISQHMVGSAFTIPHVTTFDDCDFSALKAWRKRNVDAIEEEHGVRITYLPFIAKAIIFAARKFPWINATLEDDNLHVKKYFNIGMAVARDNSLIVPVVKHCEQKTLLQIAKEMRELSEKANADKLDMKEISGGTFTITNAGGMGAKASTPIIAKPQVAILGVHMIEDKPVVRDGEIVIRPMMTFGLSFDHRVVDGGYAVQFLRTLIEYLEQPEKWLLDVI